MHNPPSKKALIVFCPEKKGPLNHTQTKWVLKVCQLAHWIQNNSPGVMKQRNSRLSLRSCSIMQILHTANLGKQTPSYVKQT